MTGLNKKIRTTGMTVLLYVFSVLFKIKKQNNKNYIQKKNMYICIVCHFIKNLICFKFSFIESN